MKKLQAESITPLQAGLLIVLKKSDLGLIPYYKPKGGVLNPRHE
jgi:hypothetical protein